ncbi:nucleic acid binding protein [Garlic virus J]|nr:nucleic acid binding protein [Garlic virus J]
MHPYDKTFICCLHLSKPSLPVDIRRLIYELALGNRKLGRRLGQNKPFQGISKCAARRRAKRYNRCFDCGAYLYDTHVCKVFSGRASSDCLSVIRQGPAKLYAEGTLRHNSDAEQLVLHDLELINLYDK